jgi:hypothetical protein
MKKISIALLAGLMASCATSYQPNYSYNEILVVNNSKELIENVTIEVVDSGRVFSCGNIAPLGICSNRFGSRSYQKEPIDVGWTFGNVARKSEAFVVNVPAYFYTGLPLRGVLEINPDGSISPYFEQDTPNR